jgi:hypothetical protein
MDAEPPETEFLTLGDLCEGKELNVAEEVPVSNGNHEYLSPLY